MNIKKFLGFTLCSLFSLTIATSVMSFSHNSTFFDGIGRKEAAIQKGAVKAEFDGDAEISRNDLRVDLRSVTSTSPTKKSAKFEFTSVRVTGFGTSKKTVYVIIDDANYSGDPSDASLDPHLTKPYTFTGYTVEIADILASKNIVLPYLMTYGTSFEISTNKLVEGALSFSTESGYIPKIETIVIPATYTTIETHAIMNVPNTVEIKCEAVSKPEGWAADWTDAANITWGYTLTSAEVTAKTQSTGTNINYYSDSVAYIIGYDYTRQASSWYCPTEQKLYTAGELDGATVCPKDGASLVEIPDVRPAYHLPLSVSYTINKNNGTIREVFEELPIVQTDPSNINPYNLVKVSPFSRDLDILLEEGESIDYSSFVFYNIFKQTNVNIPGKDNTGVDKNIPFVVPDLATRCKASVLRRFVNEISITDIITTSYKGVTTFGDYTMVSMNVDKVLPSYYNIVMSSFVTSNQEKLDSGVYSIRYALYDLSNSKYRVSYINEEGILEKKILTISTPLSIVVLEKDKGNVLSFLIKNSEVGSDFSTGRLRQFELISLTLNLHIWNNKDSNKLARTDYSVHFSAIDIMPAATTGPKQFSIVTFLVIFNVIYLVVYAGIAVSLFFILKERFKNDEFRRIKPKQYLKKAVIGYFGSAITLLTILSIIFRFGIFNNSIAVTNPIDPFVVITGIVSIIIIGYFIKNLVSTIKTASQAKMTRKLKLNEHVNEDGTE